MHCQHTRLLKAATWKPCNSVGLTRKGRCRQGLVGNTSQGPETTAAARPWRGTHADRPATTSSIWFRSTSLAAACSLILCDLEQLVPQASDAKLHHRDVVGNYLQHNHSNLTISSSGLATNQQYQPRGRSLLCSTRGRDWDTRQELGYARRSAAIARSTTRYTVCGGNMHLLEVHSYRLPTLNCNIAVACICLAGATTTCSQVPGTRQHSAHGGSVNTSGELSWHMRTHVPHGRASPPLLAALARQGGGHVRCSSPSCAAVHVEAV
jgi:hypothetical protein